MQCHFLLDQKVGENARRRKSTFKKVGALRFIHVLTNRQDDNNNIQRITWYALKKKIILLVNRAGIQQSKLQTKYGEESNFIHPGVWDSSNWAVRPILIWNCLLYSGQLRLGREWLESLFCVLYMQWNEEMCNHSVPHHVLHCRIANTPHCVYSHLWNGHSDDTLAKFYLDKRTVQMQKKISVRP